MYCFSVIYHIWIFPIQTFQFYIRNSQPSPVSHGKQKTSCQISKRMICHSILINSTIPDPTPKPEVQKTVVQKFKVFCISTLNISFVKFIDSTSYTISHSFSTLKCIKRNLDECAYQIIGHKTNPCTRKKLDIGTQGGIWSSQ